jgi:hypothetical protein
LLKWFEGEEGVLSEFKIEKRVNDIGSLVSPW